MRRSFRLLSVGAVGAVMAILVPAAMAWACVGLVSLTANPNSGVQPGATLSVVGREFAAKAPVLIHLDSITGPVLATAPPPTSTMTSQFKIQVTLPADISVGPHLLIATQDEHNMNGGNPARALIYVGTAAPATSPAQARPATLTSSSGLSLVALVVIGAGVAGVSLFLAGLVALVVARRRPEPEPAALT